MLQPTAIFPSVVRPGRVQRLIAQGAVLGLILTLVVAVSPAAAAEALSGTVTGDGTGLRGVTVELTAQGDGTVIASTTTDDSGGYTLPADAGTYDLTARPPAGSSYGPSTVNGVEVLDGTTRNVDVVLVTVGDPPAVYGTVRAGGDPVAGASIRLQGPRTRTEATSDSAGAWVAVPPSPTGALDVSADGACNTPTATLPEQWIVSSFYDVDAATTYDAEPRFVRLQVTVLNADGSPAPRARVESYADRVRQDAAAPPSAQVSAVNRGNTGCPDNLTDDAGSTSLVTVPDGTTNLEIYLPDATTPVVRQVQVGATDPAATVSLPPPPVTVSGTILGWDGQPARDVQVLLEEGSTDSLVAQISSDASGDGSFSFEATPGDYTLRFEGGANNEDLGPDFLATRPLTVPAGSDLDLGTWQPPLSAVDLRISLADTGEEVRVALIRSGLPPSIDTEVFGVDGTVSTVPDGDTGFISNTSTTDTGPAVMIAGTPYTLVPNPRSSATVPDGYDWPDGGWTVTPGATGTESTEPLALEPTQTAAITGRVLQGGVAVQGIVVEEVGGEFVRTDADGTFSLPSTVGTVTLRINSRGADAPNLASGSLFNLEVPATGVDLGDLELPWVPLDVRVATPDGEDPVLVEMETNVTQATIDSGWGPISWSGGYIASGGYTQPLLADGSSNVLWFTPSTETVNFTFAPDDSASPYQDVQLSRVVQQGGDIPILQVQLQREGTPVDQPPTISGVTPRSLDESAPNVRLSVAATDPEGEAVTITWDVLGITPAPTGPTVELGPLDGPLLFDAVATACDPAGNCASFTIEVEIRDSPPTLEAELPTSVDVGEQATLTASAADVRDDVTVTVDWGDGATAAVTGGTATHSWAAAGTYDVTVRAVTDDATTTEILTVEVAAPVPDPPVASVVSPVTVTAGRQVVLDATGSTGTGLTYAWTATGGALDQADVAQPTYTAGGVVGDFTATVTVTDDLGRTDSATVQITVEASQPSEPPAPTSAGFVTGGGWIGDGPGAGSDGTNFGFQVRSRGGAVTGTLTARMHGSDLRLVADQLDTFAVTGSTVTFSGTARVNGGDGHRFTVVTTDGGKGRGVDTFHLTVVAPDGSIVAVTAAPMLVHGQVVVHAMRPSIRIR